MHHLCNFNLAVGNQWQGPVVPVIGIVNRAAIALAQFTIGAQAWVIVIGDVIDAEI